MTNSRKRRTDNQRYYNAKKPKILADRKAAYNKVPEPKKKLASSDSYKKMRKGSKKLLRLATKKIHKVKSNLLEYGRKPTMQSMQTIKNKLLEPTMQSMQTIKSELLEPTI